MSSFVGTLSTPPKTATVTKRSVVQPVSPSYMVSIIVQSSIRRILERNFDSTICKEDLLSACRANANELAITRHEVTPLCQQETVLYQRRNNARATASPDKFLKTQAYNDKLRTDAADPASLTQTRSRTACYVYIEDNHRATVKLSTFHESHKPFFNLHAANSSVHDYSRPDYLNLPEQAK